MSDNDVDNIEKGLRGLSFSTNKELFLDIQQRGGIDKFKLESLCDEKEEIYGFPGTKLRRQVQNKVDHLKRISPTKYRLFEQEYLGSPDAPVVSQQQRPPSPKDTSHLPSPAQKIVNNTTAMTDKFGKVPYDFLVNVNPAKPWLNREVLIWKTFNVIVGTNPVISTAVYNLVFEGVDNRFLEQQIFEPFKATQVALTDVVVEKPIGSYEFVNKTMDLGDNTQEKDEIGVLRNQIGDGELDAELKGEDESLAVCFRIAVIPKDTRVVKERPKSLTKLQQKYAARNAGKSSKI